MWYESLRFMQFSNMSEHVQTCLNLFRFIMIWIDAIFKHVWTCSNLFKLVQIQYDTNCYDSYNFQTCLNLFRFNVIQIVMIIGILKHVWICWNMSKLVQIQYDMNYELLWFIRFSNMSEHVQTCLNLFRFNVIRIVRNIGILKHVWIFWNMPKLVQIQYDTNYYNS